jgi:hypothetical protein
VTETDGERRLLGQINKLAGRLQRQRMRPLSDNDAQRSAVLGLERELTTCWIELRAERAGPTLGSPEKWGRPPF